MKYYNSPQMTEYSFAGVHLRPNNQFYYQQYTNTYNGIEIEELNSVIVRDLCGNQLDDIQDYFEVVDVFQDEDTGFPQLIWRIKEECPFDFGYQLIYLEINSGANAVCYSSPFMLTEDRAEYTSLWYYKNNSDDYMYSIGLQIYYRQKKSDTTSTTYTPLSTGNQYTSAIKILKFERWHTDVIEINVIEMFKYIFDSNIIYSKPENFDGYPVLTSLKEPFETPDLEADENFSETEIALIRDYKTLYDPYAVPVTPPAPSPSDPYINLTNVTRTDSTHVKMYFNYGNFSPTELTMQYSTSESGPWTSSTGYIVSPRDVTTINNYDFQLFFRVYHFGTGTTSNVMPIPLSSITIDSATHTGDERNWSVKYTLNNLELDPGHTLTFQSSSDGVNWNKTVTASNNNNPKLVEVSISEPPQDRIRIWYERKNIISNTVMLPI